MKYSCNRCHGRLLQKCVYKYSYLYIAADNYFGLIDFCYVVEVDNNFYFKLHIGPKFCRDNFFLVHAFIKFNQSAFVFITSVFTISFFVTFVIYWNTFPVRTSEVNVWVTLKSKAILYPWVGGSLILAHK